jgi:hypothetical protein
MKVKKPLLFVGSSSEAKDNGIPQAFASALSDHARVIPWWDAPQFSAMETTIEALYQAANEYDFAVFVVTPDDKTRSRKKEHNSPRDNVIFELGLFLGTIGPSRILTTMQQGASIKLPSDLNGVTIPRFEFGDEYDLISSVNRACKSFVTRIDKLGRKKLDLLLARVWGFNSKSRKFEVQIASERLVRQQKILGERQICVAARIADHSVDFMDDGNVAFGNPRSIPSSVSSDLHLEVANEAFEEYDTKIESSKIESRLLLVPQDVEISNAKNFRQALEGGCYEMEAMSITSGSTVCPDCGTKAAL